MLKRQSAVKVGSKMLELYSLCYFVQSFVPIVVNSLKVNHNGHKGLHKGALKSFR